MMKNSGISKNEKDMFSSVSSGMMDDGVIQDIRSIQNISMYHDLLRMQILIRANNKFW